TIVDLDGRVNMNVAGNITESASVGYGYHGSNQGYGAWEINPRWLLTGYPNPFAGAFPPYTDPQNPNKFRDGGDPLPDTNNPQPWRNEYLNLFRGAVRASTGVAGPLGSYGGRYGLKADAPWDPRYYYPNINPNPSTARFPYPNGQGAGGLAAKSYGPL